MTTFENPPMFENLEGEEANLHVAKVKKALDDMGYKIELIRYGDTTLPEFGTGDKLFKGDIVMLVNSGSDFNFNIRQSMFHVNGLSSMKFKTAELHYHETGRHNPTTWLPNIQKLFQRMAERTTVEGTESPHCYSPIVSDYISPDFSTTNAMRGQNVICFGKVTGGGYRLIKVYYGGTTVSGSKPSILQNPGREGSRYLVALDSYCMITHVLAEMDRMWQYQHVTPEFAETPYFEDFMTCVLEKAANDADPFDQACKTAAYYLMRRNYF